MIGDVGKNGNYWSSSEEAGDVECAAYIFFDSKNVTARSAVFRSDGNPVRPVTDVK